MKQVSVILCVLLVMLFVVSCGRQEENMVTSTPPEPVSSEEVTLKVGVLIYSFDDTYIYSVRSAMEKYAHEYTQANIELAFNDGKNDQAIQNDQLDQLILEKPDAILINAVDAASAQGMADKVAAAKIPTIFFNREPDASVIQSCGGLFVGMTARDGAVSQGDMLADLWESDRERVDRNSDGKCQYLCFKGEPGSVEVDIWYKNPIDQVVERGVEIDPIVEVPIVANWKTKETSERMTTLLEEHKDSIEVVFCSNDDMALGVIAALQDFDFNTGDDEKWISVIGVDGIDAGLEAIEDGSLYGTVIQDGEEMGKTLVDVAVNAANGDPFPFLDGTGYELADDDVSIRIPYQIITKESLQ